MEKLMTRSFFKWAEKQKISTESLLKALNELFDGTVEANLGGHLFKKRIPLEMRGKSSGARSIICYKKDKIAVFIHGFSKNEKANISKNELVALKEFSKILVDFSKEQIEVAIRNGDFLEVKNEE